MFNLFKKKKPEPFRWDLKGDEFRAKKVELEKQKKEFLENPENQGCYIEIKLITGEILKTDILSPSFEYDCDEEEFEVMETRIYTSKEYANYILCFSKNYNDFAQNLFKDIYINPKHVLYAKVKHIHD